ncbi:MAG: NmrA family NAD(P)-binding protein [Spirochaetes bacterium]|nr:NmrA family NAD(P)-binding protein [Spirochaetota bacterium]
MPQVLIAGSTGYLGYYMTEAFSRGGFQVTAIAKDRSEERAVQTLCAMGAQCVYVDASRRESFSTALTGIDVVISCMAAPGGGNDAQGDFWAIDRDANIRLAEEAADAGVKHFILMATFEGPHSRRQTAFSDAKETAVDAITARASACGMMLTVLRPNAYFKDLTNRAFTSVREKNTYTIFGDGTVRINPIHGADVAAIALACAQGTMAGGRQYPLGGPDTFTFRELGELAASVLGTKDTLKIKARSIAPFRIIAFIVGMGALFSRSLRRRHALITWMLYALTHDAIAPSYGTHRLADEFRRKAAVP